MLDPAEKVLLDHRAAGIELRPFDRKSQQVHSNSGTRAEDGLPVATGEGGLVLRIPREAAVAEDQEIDRECPIVPRPDAQRSKQRKRDTSRSPVRSC